MYLRGDISSTETNSEAHFLKLPRELRDQIYSEALGGFTIAAQWLKARKADRVQTSKSSGEASVAGIKDHDDGFLSYECWLHPHYDKFMMDEVLRLKSLHDHSPEMSRKLNQIDMRLLDRDFISDAQERRLEIIAGYHGRETHRGTLKAEDIADFWAERPRTRRSVLLPLNLLLACRTIYNEAALVPFRENSFKFQLGLNVRPFKVFLSRLTKLQKMAIRRLSIEAGTQIYSESFPFASLDSLRSVDSLALSWSITHYAPDFTELPREVVEPVPVGIRALSRLPLREVSVLVERHKHWVKDPSEDMPSYTCHDAESAELARTFLLSGSGWNEDERS